MHIRPDHHGWQQVIRELDIVIKHDYRLVLLLRSISVYKIHYDTSEPEHLPNIFMMGCHLHSRLPMPHDMNVVQEL